MNDLDAVPPPDDHGAALATWIALAIVFAIAFGVL